MKLNQKNSIENQKIEQESNTQNNNNFETNQINENNSQKIDENDKESDKDNDNFIKNGISLIRFENNCSNETTIGNSSQEKYDTEHLSR